MVNSNNAVILSYFLFAIFLCFTRTECRGGFRPKFSFGSTPRISHSSSHFTGVGNGPHLTGTYHGSTYNNLGFGNLYENPYYLRNNQRIFQHNNNHNGLYVNQHDIYNNPKDFQRFSSSSSYGTQINQRSTIGNRFGVLNHPKIYNVDHKPYPVQTYTSTAQVYHPNTVGLPGGGIHYTPPIKIHYHPPSATSIHKVRVYQPTTTIYTKNRPTSYNDGFDYDSIASSLNDFLVGMTTKEFSYNYPQYNDQYDAHHNTYTFDSNAPVTTNTSYTVYHHYQNSQNVPRQFSIRGNKAIECPANTTQDLCVPNTDALCLRKGTIMCTTYLPFTVKCGDNNMTCVYSKIECNGDAACLNASAKTNKTYVDMNFPCLSTVTFVNDRALEGRHAYIVKDKTSYELCITAIAEPTKLSSPVGSLAKFFLNLGGWHMDEIKKFQNS